MAIGARYANILPLWEEVHITSVIPPEKLYKNREHDSIQQLLRRIHVIVYHWKDKEDNYHEREFPMSDYVKHLSSDYAKLIELAEGEMSLEEYMLKKAAEDAEFDDMLQGSDRNDPPTAEVENAEKPKYEPIPNELLKIKL